MKLSNLPTPGKDTVANRPAESGGIAGAFALLICHLFGVDDPDVLVAIGLVIGFIPAAITWLVVTIRQARSN